MIEISEIIEENSKHIGRDYWIAEVNTFSERYRIIEPTRARLFSAEESSKTIYYSNTFFKPYSKTNPEKLLKKVIPIFDNTGFRSNKGNPISVFETELEAKTWFKQKMIELLDYRKSEIERIVKLHEKENERYLKMIGE